MWIARRMFLFVSLSLSHTPRVAFMFFCFDELLPSWNYFGHLWALKLCSPFAQRVCIWNSSPPIGQHLHMNMALHGVIGRLLAFAHLTDMVYQLNMVFSHLIW